MSIGKILTLGFGTFGGVQYLPTLGYATSGTPPITTQPSGGYWEPPARKRKTKEDIRAERIALGILKEPKAQEAIKEVAVAVIEAEATPELFLSDKEQSELLVNLLAQKDLIVKNYYDINSLLLKAIGDEILHLKQLQDEEDQAIVQMLFEM